MRKSITQITLKEKLFGFHNHHDDVEDFFMQTTRQVWKAFVNEFMKLFQTRNAYLGFYENLISTKHCFVWKHLNF